MPRLPGLWMAKSQIAAGKRGKRGGVAKCGGVASLPAAVDSRHAQTQERTTK